MQFIDLKAQYRAVERSMADRLARVLEHQKFIQGPEVAEFEGELARLGKAQYVVSCANGTDALQVALMALGVGPGSAVFVPSFTYTATAEVILLLGATPVFVDVEPESYNTDLESLDQAIADVCRAGVLKPAAFIGVDLFGRPLDPAAVRAVTDKWGVSYVSDAAQSFGARTPHGPVGSLADITTTSFFPAKPLGCYGDGGAILTDDKTLADTLRSICFHGKGAGKYDIVRLGVNSRLDTIQAAILLSKLEVFESEIELRNRVAAKYHALLRGHVQTPLLPAGPDDAYSWAQYTIQVENRASVQADLSSQGVPTAVYYPTPMHLQPAYVQFGCGAGSLPASERLSQKVLNLPMHPYLSDTELEWIASRVIAALQTETV